MSEKFIQKVKEAINNGYSECSKLNEDILSIDGMSGRMGRHFLNNLVFDGCRYLEVGSHKGSTFCSALFKNNFETAFSIDNASWNGSNNDLKQNIETYIHGKTQVIEADCFNIELELTGIKDINVYFFDGPHSYEDHVRALTYYINVLSDSFIYIVDDWNGSEVKAGTLEAIKKLGLKKVYYSSLPDEEIINSGYGEDRQGWWNGIGVFVLKK